MKFSFLLVLSSPSRHVLFNLKLFLQAYSPFFIFFFADQLIIAAQKRQALPLSLLTVNWSQPTNLNFYFHIQIFKLENLFGLSVSVIDISHLDPEKIGLIMEGGVVQHMVILIPDYAWVRFSKKRS